MTSDPVVVLGFGAASVSAVLALRDAGYDGPLTVVTNAGPNPYSPVLTSYYAGGCISREQCFAWADLDVEGMIDNLVAHVAVAGLDAHAHEVAIEDGRRIRYSKLLVATGAHPVAPGFPHIDGYRPLTLRTLEDASRLRSALEDGACRSVLVSGTSMVGLKALEACLDQGVGVTLLGRSPHILRKTAHPAVAERFESLLVERGVSLRLSQTAVAAEIADDRPNARSSCAVAFSTGETERFDEVILAQGARPNLDFIGDSLLEPERGLEVDGFMRTALPDVFAAGDVARALDLQAGEKRIIGLWQNAVQQGRCAGRAIAAELAGRAPTLPYPGSIPANTIHVRDIVFASAGSVADDQRGGKGARGGIRLETLETHGAMRVFAYRSIGGADRLVGFNVLSACAEHSRHDELLCEIGMYRRQVLNSYL